MLSFGIHYYHFHRQYSQLLAELKSWAKGGGPRMFE